MGKSRATILLAVCGATLAAPVLLCALVAWVPVRSGLELGVLLAAAAGGMVFLALTAWWEFTGLVLRGLWAAMLAATALLRLVRAPAMGHAFGPVGVAAAILLGVALGAVVQALKARRHPGPGAELRFPLEGGRFLVTDGGDGAASLMVNYHFRFAGHRGAGVSGSMRYAMDVVEVGALGAEAPWLLPARNEAYRIWRRTVHAPCDGVVAHVVDDVSDNTAFGAHRPYGVGNQVVIRAPDGLHVLLGHLHHGTVRLHAGDEVHAGDVVGEVGNSGWTERPHLHMQAMRASDGDYWHGEPVPMRFGGRFLVKNQILRARATNA